MLSPVRSVYFGISVALLIAGSAFAADLPGTAEVRVVRGIFAAETGQKVDFQIPEGGRLVVKNVENKITYHLVPEFLSDDRVILRVVEPGVTGRKGVQELEAFDLIADSSLKAGVVVPFSLAAVSVKLETMRRAPVAEEVAAPGGGSGCCVTCGGWRVCCYPAAGWCCEVSSSCGTSCSACNSSPAAE